MNALVTGAGSGIGRSICLMLVNEGFQVFAVGRRLEKLMETQALSSDSSRVVVIQADVCLDSDRTKIKERIGNEPLRFLVQNAGVVGPLVAFPRVDIHDFRQVMQTNVEAPLFLAQKLLSNLEQTYAGSKTTRARILHVSSGCAHRPSPSWLTYCVSKSAFLMGAKCLHEDVKGKGVCVGSFMPGIVDTEMQDTMRLAPEEAFPKVEFFKRMKTAQMEHADANILQPRLPNPERLDTPSNVAHFVRFLLLSTSDDEFPEQDWDIRNKALASRWIPTAE